ncbi:uncharacterized protein F5Z01DRAFT_275474 [Emericellopsis atlantica]|uniref:Amine oxidase n=1 Tax=Emericellopsis atlantica TaxID=2614577 RepID=A0A9P7ZGT7_9HYPO|nr:uncharacterized protein F5Z01DRAFT_275474 [Emericellopsis atlantica]KAG9251651.1 hypothetical protein F5Z01DRAFT_275474 [Emericellopsis atlantica]
MATREGLFFDNSNSVLQRGLPCQGAIKPLTNNTDERVEFDVIIVGAGYAGLTACRDVCTAGEYWRGSRSAILINRAAGFSVLLLEARDRIGGRTFTTEVDGHLYEMGGTWVHWNQPHTYREMSRYGLTDLLPSHDRTFGLDSCTVHLNGKTRNVSHETAHAMTEKAFRLMCDVDGELGRSVIPYPHDPHFNPEAKYWEALSVAQRLDQIRTQISDDEAAILQARLSSIYGADMDKAGFFDMLRWWALGGYTMDGLYETGDDFKLPDGQSSFARHFFDETVGTQKLIYCFDTVVQSVHDNGRAVCVNDKWRAERLICTMPLNVLCDVKFEPGLSAQKLQAMKGGNINQGAKVHLEVSGSGHRSWSSAIYPVSRACSMSGDGLTPAGNTHLVCFGSNKEFTSPEDDARSFAADCKHVQEIDILKTIWHDWAKDPFAKGSWCMYPPDFSFKYLATLQERAGNVLFANSDWASGWRGYIDGAIERGTLAARDVATELRTSRCTAG